MFIEIHILQNFAPSNLNRDDTGNPKDSEFGGVRRARISSQCIKRAIRHHSAFKDTIGTDIGFRTRFLTRVLEEALKESHKSQDELERVTRGIAAYFTSKKGEMDPEDPSRTKVSVYLTPADIQWVKEEILKNWDALVATPIESPEEEKDEKKGKKSKKGSKNSALNEVVNGLVERTKGRAGAPDIAMFGRMLSDHPETNIDAACQVAHALSTHRVNMEMDFFTAVEEIATEEETGSSMMGVIGFNSACFYRYARIDWKQLVKNLGGDKALARKTVEGFLRAAAKAVPTGKQSGFAAQNPPDFILGVARTDGDSWSLVNAFETPVKPGRDGGLMSASITALDGYWGCLNTVYGGEGVRSVVLSVDGGEKLKNLKFDPDKNNIKGWVEALLAELPKE